MNELSQYDPDDYHINQTHSIYVQLEGTSLRIQRPRVNVAKRAMWNETHQQPQFIHQRHFDVTGSKIMLLPAGLVKKRVWSKKYPICIALAKPGSKMQKRYSVDTDDMMDLGFEVVSKDVCDDSLLFLFTRTGREKEEWYRRFEAASKGTPLDTGLRISDINKYLEFKSSLKHSSSDQQLRHRRQESTDSLSSITSNSSEPSGKEEKETGSGGGPSRDEIMVEYFQVGTSLISLIFLIQLIFLSYIDSIRNAVSPPYV